MNIQKTIADTVYAMLMAHDVTLNRLQTENQTPALHAIAADIRRVLENKLIVYSDNEILSIRQPFYNRYLHLEFSRIIDYLLQVPGSTMTLPDIQGFMKESMDKHLIRDYIEFARIAILHFPGDIKPAFIDELIGKCDAKGVYDSGYQIVDSLIGSGVQFTTADLGRWMQIFTPGTSVAGAARAGNWEQYAALAQKILDGCDVVPGWEFTATYPGIAGTITYTQFIGWVKALKDAGRLDLAVKLELTAFSKGYTGTDPEAIIRSIESVSRANHEAGVLLHAYAIECLPKENLTRKIIHEWGDDAGGYTQSENMGKILMAAVNRDLADRGEVVQWVTSMYRAGLHKQSIATACAALSKENPVPDFDTEDLLEMMQCGDAYATEILCAGLRGWFGPKITMDIVLMQCTRNAERGRLDLLCDLAVAALETNNMRALHGINASLAGHYKYATTTSSDVQGLAALFMHLNDHEQGVRLIVYAAGRKAIAGISGRDITSWGEQCVKAGKPVLAVEMGIAAQDAGVDVPAEQIQQWQSACYDNKPADAALNNAIALMKIYRNQPGFGKEITEEINAAFGKVMQRRDALGLTLTTPYLEALEKIDSILFAEGEKQAKT